jgi:hypothetical protein
MAEWAWDQVSKQQSCAEKVKKLGVPVRTPVSFEGP